MRFSNICTEVVCEYREVIEENLNFTQAKDLGQYWVLLPSHTFLADKYALSAPQYKPILFLQRTMFIVTALSDTLQCGHS